MSLNVSTLGTYTRQNAKKMITGLVTGARTVDFIKSNGNVMTYVKNAETVNQMDTDAVFQDGSVCGWTASGTTAITQRTLTVGSIAVMEAICLKNLEKKYLSEALSVGGTYTQMIFEEQFMGKKLARIQTQLEKAIWQGDTANTGNTTLKWFDGFIKILNNAPNVATANAKPGVGTITASTASATVTGVGTIFTTLVAVGDKLYNNGTLLGTVLTVTSDTSITLAANSAANASGTAYNIVPALLPGTTTANPYFSSPILASTGITASNILTILDNILLAVPEAVLDSSEAITVFGGLDVSRLIKIALRQANLYHYKPDMKATDSFAIPGLDLVFMPTPGLSGTNQLFAIQGSNMYFGTDLLNEEERMLLEYAKEAKEIRFDACFKAGVQVGYPDQCTRFALA